MPRIIRAALWIGLAAPLGSFPLLGYLAGRRLLSWDSMVIGLLVIAALTVFMTCGALIGGLAMRESRLLKASLYGIVLLISLYATRLVHRWSHIAFWTEIARRGDEIVVAISNYELQSGRPPDSLKALIPKYLQAIPATGFARQPSFRYTLSDYHSWLLEVDHFPPGNVEALYYLKSRDYWQLCPSGWVEDIGDWGYVHE